MASWTHPAALLLLLVTAGAHPFEFQERQESCSGPSERCVNISDCPAYRTRQGILNSPPTPCGFRGVTPLVCCAVPPTQPPPPPPPPLPTQCGRTSAGLPPGPHRFRRDDHALIQQAVGGVDAELGRWPWMVLFGRWTDAGLGDWFCGGTLITDRHVLTAAHCLRPEQAGTVGARIGDNDLRTPLEADHQERGVRRVVRHPQYRAAQNDLAVVRLDKPVRPTEAVQPICLPPAGAQHVGRDVEMAGWGLLEFGGQPSDVLQQVPLRVVDPAACEAAYRRVPTFEAEFPGGFQGTKVCAGSRDEEPRDACRGDSGGPLMVQLPDGTYQLVGVVSTGVGCGNPDFPGVYTMVSAYRDWIASSLT